MGWWKLEIISGADDLDDADKEYIAELIKQGYTEGKLNEEVK